MAWFLSPSSRTPVIRSENLRLGRYTDAYKSADQIASWERSIGYFASGQILKSFQHFLVYLYDPVEQNIHWVTDRDGNFSFELFQGSRRISGYLGGEECSFQTNIGLGQDLPECFLEELLRTNYRLRNAWYGEEDGRVVLRFVLAAAEADPFRLQAALRELAFEADMKDDVFVRTYPELQPLRELHIRERSERETVARMAWFRSELNRLVTWYRDEKEEHDRFAGGFSYAVLDLMYKVEFLMTPQGMLRNVIAGLHDSYLRHRVHPAPHYLNDWMGQLEEIMAWPEEQLRAEFYDVVTTFGQSESISQERLRWMIRGQLEEMDTWMQAGKRPYAHAIPGFIMGYCLYRYAIPGLIRDLFALYYLVRESGFASSMGYPVFRKEDGSWYRHAIQRSIRTVAGEWEGRHRISGLDPGLVRTRDSDALGRSWLEMVSQIKVEEQ